MPLTDEQWGQVTDAELDAEFCKRGLDEKLLEENQRDFDSEVTREADGLIRTFRESESALWESLYNQVRGKEVPEPLRELIWNFHGKIA